MERLGCIVNIHRILRIRAQHNSITTLEMKGQRNFSWLMKIKISHKGLIYMYFNGLIMCSHEVQVS